MLISERHANSFFLAPDDMAMLALAAAHDVQRDFMRNSHEARDLERRPDRRNVAYRAIDAAAVEFDRSGL